MKDTQEYRVGTGASLMLMIVVVLMLAVMGMLALSSAQAGKRQTDQNVRTVTDTYAAYAMGERVLAQIDEAQRLSDSQAELRDRVLALQTEGLTLEWTAEDEISMTIPADAQRQLRAVIRIGAKAGLQVRAWQIERTDVWETDDSLTLFDGTAF